MKAYILAVCGAAILSALVMLLLPPGKTGKFIGGILKLFCLLVMLLPLLFFFTDFKTSFGASSQEEGMQPDGAFIESVFSRRAEQEEESLEALLKKEFSVEAEAQIGWKSVEYAFTVTDVLVSVKDFGIYENGEHILITEQIAGRVSGLYKDAEVTVQ